MLSSASGSDRHIKFSEMDWRMDTQINAGPRILFGLQHHCTVRRRWNCSLMRKLAFGRLPKN